MVDSSSPGAPAAAGLAARSRPGERTQVALVRAQLGAGDRRQRRPPPRPAGTLEPVELAQRAGEGLGRQVERQLLVAAGGRERAVDARRRGAGRTRRTRPGRSASGRAAASRKWRRSPQEKGCASLPLRDSRPLKTPLAPVDDRCDGSRPSAGVPRRDARLRRGVRRAVPQAPGCRPGGRSGSASASPARSASGSAATGPARRSPGCCSPGHRLERARQVLEAYNERVLHVDEYPSDADVLYLGLYPAIAAGLALLIRRRSAGATGPRSSTPPPSPPGSACSPGSS